MEARGGTARQGEHRISFTDHASGSRERVGAEIDEKATSPLIEPHVDEGWIEELQEKFERGITDSPRQSRMADDKREPLICKSTLLDEEFSQPKVVTIGPFHRHNSKSIDKEKWFVMQFMSRLYNLDVAGCAQKMENQAANALKCYFFSDKPPCFESTGFVEILLLDSYFILLMLTYKDTLRRAMQREQENIVQSPDDPYRFLDDPFRFLGIMMQKNEIMLDLLILDNQIPFFVIEELYKELKLEKPLHEYALDFFETIHPTSHRGRKGQNGPPKFLHLLDLFHWSRVPKEKYYVVNSPHNQLSATDLPRYTPTAMELRESATMFKKKTLGSSLDITFRRGRLIRVVGVLNIPRLHIHDYSSRIFHNLIAFEMQCPSRSGYCTMAFSAFMRSLLQSEEDVKLLRRRGILANTSVTDSELVDFFKRLSKLTENCQMPNDLSDVYHQVLSHHNRRMSRFCGSIVLQYFPNPLVTLSVFAAVLLFVLNFLQTIYTVLSYYHS